MPDVWVTCAVAAALLCLAGCGGDGDPVPAGQSAADATAKAEPLLPAGKGHLLARVRKPVLLHTRPGGRPIARLRPKTPFGEPRTLGVHVLRRAGRWLGVHSPVLGNERTGWLKNDPAKLRLTRTTHSLHVDLSRKRIEHRRGGRTISRFPIAIGAAGTSTPPGRFQITDKLRGDRFPRAAYGCCILALSARQPNLPEGWPGGDRIAIHGTPLESSIGTASSNGCLRAKDSDLEPLMRDVPVGAPVFISP